jgi:serine/threonine protein kinase
MSNKAVKMSPGGEAMQGLSEDNEVAPVERSKVYTATGDAIVRQQYQDPLLGQVLEDKYLIEEVIGWGGMSLVYRARHVLVDRIVAIKTVKFRADERPDIWQRFQREIITLSRLSHPNVVTVYDCVVGSNGQPYVVMDLIQGCTLDDVLQNKGRLPLRQLCSIASQVASAVDHAHRHDVIHRDLKPANIMILGDPNDKNGNDDGECEVKVVDFGLAKLGEDDQKLTQTGQLWGSPPYISPEQIKGGDLDHRCDIYSLGVVVYEMATGRDPFGSDIVYEMLHHHLHHDPPPFAEICPNDPPPRELEAVVRRAMAKDPAARYQSMADFKEDLEKACLMAENRLAAGEAKTSQLRSSAARATTGRLTALPRSSANRLRPMAATRCCASPQSGPRLTRSNQLYLALSALLIFAAAVMGVNRSPFAPRTAYASSGMVATTGKMGSSTQAGKGLGLSRIAPVSFSTRTKAGSDSGSSANQQLSSHPAEPAAPGSHSLLSHPSHTSGRYMSSERSQVKHSAVFTNILHHPPATSSVKKSLPNASQLSVDQSKFQLLRDLKSPILRQECGDLPQH